MIKPWSPVDILYCQTFRFGDHILKRSKVTLRLCYFLSPLTTNQLQNCKCASPISQFRSLGMWLCFLYLLPSPPPTQILLHTIVWNIQVEIKPSRTKLHLSLTHYNTKGDLGSTASLKKLIFPFCILSEHLSLNFTNITHLGKSQRCGKESFKGRQCRKTISRENKQQCGMGLHNNHLL